MKTMFRAALVFAALLAMAAPAAAQSISADPPAVSEAGEHEFTVSGTGFANAGFLLPCPGANGDPAAMAADSCDLTSLMPYEAGDWSVTVTYDIPAEGLVIVAGDADRTENGVTVIAVGDLPNTGANTNAYLMVGFALAAGAAALVAGGRRMQHA